MKKIDLSDNQLKTRPAFPVLVTYTLEIVVMVLIWSFLLSYPWEPFSADAAKIIGITQMTGGLIVLYCFCLPQRGCIRRLRTLLYGGTTIMILPAIIGAQQDAHKLTLSLDNLLVPGMVILLCSSVVFCVCRLCAGDVPDGDVDVREGTAVSQTTLAEQFSTEISVLPLRPDREMKNVQTITEDHPVVLEGIRHIACSAAFVIRIDGSTCLQLWNATGLVTRLEGDPLQVAQWLNTCHDAGIYVRVQVNESLSSVC